jgi:hypothetical protein
MTSLAPFAANTQADQHSRAVGHKPFKPDLPTDHRCPQGACATPPPPPPVKNEPFAPLSAQQQQTTYWLLIAGLTGALAFVSYLNRK